MSTRIHYGNIPEIYRNDKTARTVIVPVCFDGTSTWGKGADKGPQALLQASANMELYDIETDSEVYKTGIITDEAILVNPSVEAMVEAVYARVKKHLQHRKFVGVIGGEHSVSIGAIQAHAEHFENLSLLQLDAHCDLRESYEGSKYNHACVMARAREHCPIVQAGIRSMDANEKKTMDTSRVFFTETCEDRSDWPNRIVELLSDQVYLTLDLDVFDPAIMPSTGTPEPGGLGWNEVLRLLKQVIAQKKLVGFDVVELCPNPANRGPDFLAAKLIYKILSYTFEI